MASAFSCEATCAEIHCVSKFGFPPWSLANVARCSASARPMASRCACVSAGWPGMFSSRATWASWSRTSAVANRFSAGVEARCSARRPASISPLLMSVAMARAFAAEGASTAFGTTGLTGPPGLDGVAESATPGGVGATAVPRASLAATSGDAPPQATLRSTAPAALSPVWMPDCVPGCVVSGEPLRAAAPGASGALGW